ncbi:MYND-type domain-containing protein [Mycena kentingensis (nom. inval.)]|nr:MYND-type domain-containing protein [Mycena kentingensis (nom. inval.)]
MLDSEPHHKILQAMGLIEQLAKNEQETPTKLREALVGLDDGMATFTAVFKNYQSFIASQREKLVQALQAVVYPIHKLPPEILIAIFEEYMLDAAASNFIPKISSALILASVCQRWRDVTLDVPKLWSRIALPQRPSKSHPQFAQLVQTCMQRSRGAPLTLSIAGCKNTILIDILATKAACWRDLRVDQAVASGRVLAHIPELPNLETIRMQLHLVNELKTIALGALPRLREAIIEWGCLSQVKLPWSQLAELTLLCHDADDVLPILRQTVNLESLKLKVNDPSDLDTLEISLPHLHTLSLDAYYIGDEDDPVEHSLLSLLKVPALKSLTIRDGAMDTYQHFHTFVHGNQFVLESLDLVYPKHEDDLIACAGAAKSTSCISELELTLPQSEYLTRKCLAQLTRPASKADDTPLFPRLQVLRLNTDTTNDVPYTHLRAFINARHRYSERAPGQAALEELTFRALHPYQTRESVRAFNDAFNTYTTVDEKLLIRLDVLEPKKFESRDLSSTVDTVSYTLDVNRE